MKKFGFNIGDFVWYSSSLYWVGGIDAVDDLKLANLGNSGDVMVITTAHPNNCHRVLAQKGDYFHDVNVGAIIQIDDIVFDRFIDKYVILFTDISFNEPVTEFEDKIRGGKVIFHRHE